MAPITSKNMTADSREGKCLRRSKTAQSQGFEEQLGLDPYLVCVGGAQEGRPHKQSGEEIKSREESHSIPTGISLDCPSTGASLVCVGGKAACHLLFQGFVCSNRFLSVFQILPQTWLIQKTVRNKMLDNSC